MFLKTAWTLQVFRGLLLWCVAALLAGLMADLYGQDALRHLVPAAGLTVLISGFNSTSIMQLQRHLRVGKLAAIELTSQLCGVVVMIVWALAHPTVWALVGGGVSGAVVKLVLSHAISRPLSLRWVWDRASGLEILDLGKWIFLSSMLFFLAGQADRLIFGRLLSVSMLGVYSIAVMFATMPTQVLWTVGNSVVFPAFSRRREANGALDSAYRRAQRPLLVLGALPVACLVACGPALIETLYDPRYADAGWMLQLLALGTWLQIPQTTSGAALLALGAPRWIALGNALKFAGMLILVLLGFVFFGAAGGITGFAASELFRYVTFVVGVRGHGLPALGDDLKSSALVLVVSLAGLAAAHSIRDAGSGSLVELAGALGVVLLLWAPMAALFLRQEIPNVRAGIRTLLRRTGAGASTDLTS